MVKQTRVIPDYDGGSIVNLMASIARGLDADGGRYDSLRLLPQQRISEYRQVALIVVDGLGFDFLHEHAELAPTLAACASGSMTSVFPSTTAAAIGTYLTGVAPVEHGLTGWNMYLRELAAVLAVLPGFGRSGAPLYNDRVDVGELLGTTPFAARLGVDTVMVAPRSIAGSPFNRSHQGGSTLYPYDTLEQLFMYTAAALAEPGRRYIYSYWPELDHIGHKRGMGSKATLDLMRTLEAQFCAFLESIRGTQTLVLLTADHGHINTSAERTFTLNDFPEVQQHLRLPLCGEPRAAYVYLRSGADEPFLRALQDSFGDEIVARPSRDVLAEGWFGPGPAHPELLNRIGDYVLLPQSNQMVRDWLPLERRFPLQSAHGGLTQAEMLVPLVIAESD